MKINTRATRENGFSILELLVSLLVLVPVMAAVMGIFSVTADQHSSEQTSIQANQEARSGLELMTLELGQAGSHGDRSTTTTGAITALVTVQNVTVVSSVGFNVGDYVDVDTGAQNESVKITAVGANSISGIFRVAHAANAPVRLFALPYLTGVIRPAGLAANSSAVLTKVRFFGNMNGDGTVYYVEYDYDNANAQITRSITPITQATMNAALPLVRNVKPNSVQFTVYTDALGVVTAAQVAMTVQNTWTTAGKLQETALSSRVGIPSAVAGSALLNEYQIYGGPNKLPPTPSRVTTWSTQ